MTPAHTIIFLGYLATSGYNAGVLWAMQLMHYPLYTLVGEGDFVRYISANNQRAVPTAIIPAVLNIIFSGLLLWRRPGAVPQAGAVVALALSLGVLAASLAWQAGIHTKLAHDGKSPRLIRQLVSTNWVRTALDTLQLLLALWMVAKALR
jgi:hypothetical protein